MYSWPLVLSFLYAVLLRYQHAWLFVHLLACAYVCDCVCISSCTIHCTLQMQLYLHTPLVTLQLEPPVHHPTTIDKHPNKAQALDTLPSEPTGHSL